MLRADNGKRRYEVHLSGAMANRMRQIQQQATREGRGQTVLDAFRQIVQQLQRDPLGFGEPLYRLPALRLQVRHGGVLPLFVDFAVSEDRPLVFIKGVTLLAEQVP